MNEEQRLRFVAALIKGRPNITDSEIAQALAEAQGQPAASDVTATAPRPKGNARPERTLREGTTRAEGLMSGAIKGILFGAQASGRIGQLIARLQGASPAEAEAIGGELKGKIDRAAAENPGMAFVGGALNPASWYLGNKIGGLGPAASGTANAVRAGGRQVAQGVIGGGLLGGVYGAAEGDPVGGAAAGATFGLLAPIGGAVVRGAGRWTGLAKTMMVKEQASKALQDIGERAGFETPLRMGRVGGANAGEQMLTHTANKTAGMPGSLVDAGPAFQRLGVDVALASPKAGKSMQDFATKRAAAGEIPAQVLGEAAAAVGEPATSTRASLADIVARQKQRDNLRFNSLRANFPDPISDVGIIAQWNAIIDALPGQLKGLKKLQQIRMAPSRDIAVTIRSGPYKDGTAPTIAGVHELLKNLKAEVRSPSIKASKKVAYTEAIQRLENMTFTQVKGGSEFQRAMVESAADFRVRDAFADGAQANRASGPKQVKGQMTAPLTAEDMQARLNELQAAPPPASYPGVPDLPDPVRAYRLGYTSTLRKLQGKNPVANPRTAGEAAMPAVTALRGSEIADKLRAVAAPVGGSAPQAWTPADVAAIADTPTYKSLGGTTDPADHARISEILNRTGPRIPGAPAHSLADAFLHRVEAPGGYASMAETNALQLGGATPEAPILRVKGNSLAGGFGAARAATGSLSGLKLALGAAVTGAIKGFSARGTRAAGEHLAPMLQGLLSDPKTFTDAMAVANYLRDLQRARLGYQGGIIGGLTSGVAAGGLLSQR